MSVVIFIIHALWMVVGSVLLHIRFSCNAFRFNLVGLGLVIKSIGVRSLVLAFIAFISCYNSTFINPESRDIKYIICHIY